MAVEARQLNLFPSQILGNRELMMNTVEGIGNVYGVPMGYAVIAPLSGTTTAAETVLPMYGSAAAQAVPAMKSDSGVTYAIPDSRKRSRDAINPLVSTLQSGAQVHSAANNRCGSFTFLGEDFSRQFQQQQLEIDWFIAQHTEKVRMEIEERRKRFTRRIAAALQENSMKKLKAKEEEIEKIGKLNWALEERVKSLCEENEIWRDLAQTNEATANALRCNLEQVLAQVEDEQHQEKRHQTDDAAVMDDAQSCCGSNLNEIERPSSADSHSTGGRDRDYNSSINRNRMCRSCGKEESCVLLLPCRHLCLCTVCGSSFHTCPVCNSTKTASVHVNLTAS